MALARSDEDAGICFCTLGMFIIDEIHFRPPTPPVHNILGGAGTYAALGARLLSPPPLSKRIGWIVDAGSDFPPELHNTIASWQTSCLIRETPNRLTTRGWNGYGENEHRSFRYITPKLRLDHASLTPQLLMSKTFHLICSPQRCIDLVQNILARRLKLNGKGSLTRPVFLWEPVPDLCTAEQLGQCYEALKHVDIVSPNHGELAGFFGKFANNAEGHVDSDTVEWCVRHWLSSGVGSDGEGAAVVRAGKDGCYAASRRVSRWFPAYHQASERVVDPTGGGNAFLGGLAIGRFRDLPFQAQGLQDIEKAAIMGTIAASFAIEQVGVPTLGADAGGEETWNGVKVQARLTQYLHRLACLGLLHLVQP